MTPEPKMDLDEPVNVDLDPEEALKLLLGAPDEDQEDVEADTDVE